MENNYMMYASLEQSDDGKKLLVLKIYQKVPDMLQDKETNQDYEILRKQLFYVGKVGRETSDCSLLTEIFGLATTTSGGSPTFNFRGSNNSSLEDLTELDVWAVKRLTRNKR